MTPEEAFNALSEIGLEVTIGQESILVITGGVPLAAKPDRVIYPFQIIQRKQGWKISAQFPNQKLGEGTEVEIESFEEAVQVVCMAYRTTRSSWEKERLETVPKILGFE